jgi:hypothetical protein
MGLSPCDAMMTVATPQPWLDPFDQEWSKANQVSTASWHGVIYLLPGCQIEINRP